MIIPLNNDLITTQPMHHVSFKCSERFFLNKIAFRSKYLPEGNSFVELSHLCEAFPIILVTSEQHNVYGIKQCGVFITILHRKHKHMPFVKNAVTHRTNFLVPQKHVANICSVPYWVQLEILKKQEVLTSVSFPSYEANSRVLE